MQFNKYSICKFWQPPKVACNVNTETQIALSSELCLTEKQQFIHTVLGTRHVFITTYLSQACGKASPLLGPSHTKANPEREKRCPRPQNVGA